MRGKAWLCAGGITLLSVMCSMGLLISAEETAAYLNHTTDEAVNRFDMGRVTGTLVPEIKEVFTPNGESLQVTKEVRVLNRVPGDGSPMSAFVRLRLIPVFRTTGADGVKTGLMGAVEEPVGSVQQVISPDGIPIKLILSGNWQADWFYRDGIFYYRQAVAAGAVTSPLLTAVTTERTAAWGTFRIEVLAEAASSLQPELVEQAWGVTIENAIIQSK